MSTALPEPFTWRGIAFTHHPELRMWHSSTGNWWVTQKGEYDYVALLGLLQKLRATGLTPQAALDALALTAADAAAELTAALGEVT